MKKTIKLRESEMISLIKKVINDIVAKIMPKTKYRGLNTKRGKCAIKKDQSISANSKCNINFVNVKIHFSRSWPRILVYMIKAVRVIQL